jgi:hypothetical protein
MDIIKQLAESKSRDVIISLPKNKTWIEYLMHFTDLQHTNGTIHVFVQEIPKTEPGNKCYIVFDGILRGWMKISKLTETQHNEVYLELLPNLNEVGKNVPMSEIDGFKYYFHLDAN